MSGEPALFGAQLRRLRCAAALSQEALAELAGLSQRGISDLERGVRRAPHLATVDLLAKALELGAADRQALLTAARPNRNVETRLRALPGRAPLPVPLTPLIGREAEIAAVCALLDDSATRLLTLTGPGGVGKTRLALAIARDVANHFADGVVWVDLAPLHDPTLLPATVASTLEIQPNGQHTITEVIGTTLRGRQVLLLLDNCEHLVAAAAELVSLVLLACPALQILATSRAPLQVRGEHELPIDPLPLPGIADVSLETIARNEAVRLFTERARAVRPGFSLNETSGPAVVALCRRLDGLPLAIELAAVHVKLLSPEALLARLTNRLRLLDQGPRDLPARQQTMRDAIAWSHDLLSPEAQGLFRRLAVFTGGWTIEAAVDVARMDEHQTLTELGMLVDQSLVRLVESDGASRFSMLETIREFGWEKLQESAEEKQARDAHAAWSLDFVETANRHLEEGSEERRWLRRLDAEIDNLRDTMTWLIQQRSTEFALRLAIALADNYWHDRSGFAEGQAALEHALALDDPPTHLEIGALWRAGVMAHHAGNYVAVERFAPRALALAVDHQDVEGAAGSHVVLSLLARHRADYADAIPHMEATIALRRPGHWRWLGYAINALGVVTASLGEYDRAEALYEEARTLFAERDHVAGVAIIQGNLADLARRRGQMERGLPLYQGGLRHFWDFQIPDGVGEMLAGIAAIAADRGHHEFAAYLLGATDALRDRIGFTPYGLYRDAYDACMGLVRASLREQAVTRAVAAGRQASMDTVITAALGFDLAAPHVPLPVMEATEFPGRLRPWPHTP